MSYLKQAFQQAIEESNRKKAGEYYVTLWEVQSYYGGPEEGGWWGHDYVPIEYSVFSTEEEAEAVKMKVQELAKQLSHQAKMAWGKQCQNELDFCDSRGLDYDSLPETNGPDEYSVTVSQEPPSASYGARGYS